MMKKYARMVDGTLEILSKKYVRDEVNTYSNPTEEQILLCGYTEYEEEADELSET